MRAIFVLLLLVNLAVLGWIYHDSSAPGTPAAEAQIPGVETITLLNELQQAKSGAEGATQQPQPAPAESPAEDVVAAAPAEISEPEAVSAPVTDEPPAEAKSQPETVVVQDSCHTIGPFRDLDKLRNIIRTIRSDVKEASFRTRNETEQTLFRVYLEPERHLEAAKATTNRLRKSGIKDSFIINDGDKRFGISLGYFREKQRAYKLRDQVKSKGFKPVLEPVFREVTIYWLDYRLAPGKAGEDLLKGLKLDKSVSRFDRACV